MKKFQFTLEKVFRFRSQQLEIEMNTLALMRYELVELENRLAHLRNELGQKHDDYQMKSQRGMRVIDIQEYQYFKDTLEEQIKAALQEREELIERINQQLLIVLEFKKEVSGLEKLKEKQWEEYQEMERKAETEFILELVSAKTINPESN